MGKWGKDISRNFLKQRKQLSFSQAFSPSPAKCKPGWPEKTYFINLWKSYLYLGKITGNEKETISVTNFHWWARLLIQQSSVIDYRLPIVSNKFLIANYRLASSPYYDYRLWRTNRSLPIIVCSITSVTSQKLAPNRQTEKQIDGQVDRQSDRKNQTDMNRQKQTGSRQAQQAGRQTSRRKDKQRDAKNNLQR